MMQSPGIAASCPWAHAETTDRYHIAICPEAVRIEIAGLTRPKLPAPWRVCGRVTQTHVNELTRVVPIIQLKIYRPAGCSLTANIAEECLLAMYVAKDGHHAGGIRRRGNAQPHD